MGYRKIPNLYNDQSVLMFRQVYVMEKIHGTSAYVMLPSNVEGEPPREPRLFSGGMKHDTFSGIFDGVRCPTVGKMVDAWREHKTRDADLVVYGEAFGGKEQGMSATYGKDARFVAFEVKIGDAWLSVPDAHALCARLGIPFVWYELVDCTLENLDRARDKPSPMAQEMLGIEAMMEGVVIRPPVEVTDNDGNRFMAKHKRPEFSERKSNPNIDPAKKEQRLKDQAAAAEFVTLMRIQHVVDGLLAGAENEDTGFAMDMQHTPDFLRALAADVMTEEGVPDTPAFRKAVSKGALPAWKELVLKAQRQRLEDADGNDQTEG